MRVLHVITSLRIGGAEHLLIDLLPRLKKKGVEVEIAVLDGKRTPFYEELLRQGISIHSLGKGGWMYNPLYIFRLFPLMKKFDIIHSHNTSPFIFVALANVFLKKKLCFTAHSSRNKANENAIIRKMYVFFYMCYDAVICVSDNAENNVRYILEQDVSRPQILTIYNGVDVDKYISALVSTELVPLKGESIVITMVAGFRDAKDQDTLIRSLAILPPKFHLWLVGDGVRKNQLELLAKDLSVYDRITFLGFRSDIPSILKTSDIVVMSSHYEGLSLSSIEGMASGKPFIASDVAGLHEIVSGYGVMFAHQDSCGLASEIKKLVEDSNYYSSVVSRCMLRAQQYDISKMAKKYLEVYQMLNGSIK